MVHPFSALLLLLAPAALAAHLPRAAVDPNSPSSIPPATAGSILTPETDDFINSVLKTWKSPGVAVAIVQMDGDGQWKVESKGYGIENHEGKPMTGDSLFGIGSNSKLLTAIATGLLVHNESVELDWTSKMKDVVPDWALMDPFATEKADLRDLFGHRTGLPRHDMMTAANDSIEFVVSRLRYLRPSVEFRQQWQYNNLPYMLAAKLPHYLILSHPTFLAYLQTHILEPLNMSSTTTSIVAARSTGNMCDGYTPVGVSAEYPLGREKRPIPYWLGDGDGDIIDGAGGVISSVRDAAIWIQMLLLQGRNPVTNETVVPAEVVAVVEEGVSVEATVRAWPELSPLVYGAGTEMQAYRGHRFIEHGGSTPGFATQILRLPDEMAGIALFVNQDVYGSSLYETIKFTLLDKMLNLFYIDWVERYQSAINASVLSTSPPSPRPSNASTPDLSLVPGIYHDPAYQTIELCFVSAPPSAESDACAAVRAAAPTILPGAINASIPTLLAHVNRLFTSHLRLQHFDGNVWNVTEFTSQASLQGGDYYANGAYGASADSVAEFDDVDGGFGITGGFWGAGEGVRDPQAGVSVKERSEVWFEKV